MSEKKKRTIFRRIRGRIVPITIGEKGRRDASVFGKARSRIKRRLGHLDPKKREEMENRIIRRGLTTGAALGVGAWASAREGALQNRRYQVYQGTLKPRLKTGINPDKVTGRYSKWLVGKELKSGAIRKRARNVAGLGFGLTAGAGAKLLGLENEYAPEAAAAAGLAFSEYINRNAEDASLVRDLGGVGKRELKKAKGFLKKAGKIVLKRYRF